MGRNYGIMINEIIEVESYLAGDNIRKNECTFRMCYLMAKYFRAKGLDPLEIRKAIFKWGRDNDVFILHNVNDIIRMAISDGVELCKKEVYVNDDDIKEIKDRFSTKNSRLCALAILLFAKAHADEEGIFTFSQNDFSKWIHLQQSHTSTCLEELEVFDYIDKIYSSGEQTFAWNGRIVGKRIRYRLLVDYKNVGNYKIENNDVRDLFQKIFEHEE